MLSLQSVRTLEQLDTVMASMERQLEGSCAFVSELKYDGMAMALHYENGTLKRVLTRGDGVRGEVVALASITEHVVGIPERVDVAQLEVRGELVMRNSEFEKLRASIEVLPANPRNAVAGMVRSGAFRGAQVDFIAYGSALQASSHTALRDVLVGLGFKVCEFGQRHANRDDALECARLWMVGQQAQSKWPSDGMVFKVDDHSKSQAMGSTRHHPRAMVAFKWGSGHVAQSVIREIEWSVDGRGFARPVARFDPVTVDGAVLERASLYNWEYVSRHGLRVGSHVGIERAGGVIPRIIPMAGSDGNGALCPSTCSCGRGSHFEIVGQHLRCVDHAQCPQRRAYRAAQLAETLGIPGIGPAVSKRLEQEGLLSSDWALLELTPALMMDRGWTEASAKRICNQVSMAVGRATFLETLLLMNVPGMGAAAWSNVALRFPSWQSLRGASEEQLALIPGVGASRSKSIVELLNSPLGDSLAIELARLKLPLSGTIGTHAVPDPGAANGDHFPLQGKRICITGRLSKPRAQFGGALRKQGASVTGSLSSKTSYLICGTDPSIDDVTKAQRLGVPILNEDQVESMIHSTTSHQTKQ